MLRLYDQAASRRGRETMVAILLRDLARVSPNHLWIMHLNALLKAVGPNSALIFAAWIFMGFLQQRYIAALEKYRMLIDQFRHHESSPAREQNLNEQILLYKKRCELMKCATNVGLVAAILLIATLILAGFATFFGGVQPLKYSSAACAFVGLGLSSWQRRWSFKRTRSSNAQLTPNCATCLSWLSSPGSGATQTPMSIKRLPKSSA